MSAICDANCKLFREAVPFGTLCRSGRSRFAPGPVSTDAHYEIMNIATDPKSFLEIKSTADGQWSVSAA